MPHQVLASFSSHHNCLTWVAIFIGSLYISDTFKAGFDEMLGNIQAEAR